MSVAADHKLEVGRLTESLASANEERRKLQMEVSDIKKQLHDQNERYSQEKGELLQEIIFLKNDLAENQNSVETN